MASWGPRLHCTPVTTPALSVSSTIVPMPTPEGSSAFPWPVGAKALRWLSGSAGERVSSGPWGSWVESSTTTSRLGGPTPRSALAPPVGSPSDRHWTTRLHDLGVYERAQAAEGRAFAGGGET